MKARHKSGIFAQIWSGFAALCFFVVLLTGCICIIMVRQYAINNAKNDLTAKASLVSQIAAQPAGITRLLNQEKLYEIQRLTDAQLIYVDRDLNARLLSVTDDYTLPEQYRTEMDYGLVDTQIIDSVDKELIDEILSGENIAELIRLNLLNTSIILCGSPIFSLSDDGLTEVSGAVILYRPLEVIWSSVTDTLYLFGAAGLISVLLSLLLSLFLSRRFSKPILALSSVAREISDGNYGIVTDVYSSRELDELANSLNVLSANLKTVVGSLSNEKSKLEQILRGIGEGIIAVDKDDKIIHHNAAALDLTDSTQVKQYEETKQFREMEPMLHKAMAEGGRYETKWTLNDGRQIVANIYPVYGESGEYTTGAVALMRDVSESARLEQMRRDYIANISHELRTPLTGIRGMVEPLIDGVIEGEEEKQNCYNIIYQETVRLQKLIGDMLDMSRLQDGRIEIPVEELDVAAICLNVCMRMSAHAKDIGISLSTQLSEQSIYCLGNEDRIIQVLVILLDNAFSFTPVNGSIQVFCRKEDGYAAFGVQDSGSGIDPKDLPYIWERFFKADRSRMRTSGTGLGLSIAKMIVTLMNGNIGVESTLGVGSTFTVRLPLAEQCAE